MEHCAAAPVLKTKIQTRNNNMKLDIFIIADSKDTKETILFFKIYRFLKNF